MNKDEARPQFGNRYLTSEAEVFRHNAWDDVEWDLEQEQQAEKAVQTNSTITLTPEQIADLEEKAADKWDLFYGIHSNRFFKDRHWLFTEFQELCSGEYNSIFELGCGVGNTILPILQYNQADNLQVFGADFSCKAIELLQKDAKFDGNRARVFVMDCSVADWQDIVPFQENSLDLVVLIFVLSAIEPVKHLDIVKNVYKYLRPGGMVLFRDYGRYDLAQLRFKPGKSLGDNFYVRGDGTRVYFFTQEEVKTFFVDSGFEEVQNRADRRLQVNRGKLLKMYRVWIQAKYQKPLVD